MLVQEILEKLEVCKDAKEVQTLAKEYGYELTDEQAQEAYDAINGEREITDAELAKIYGGGSCWPGSCPRYVCDDHGK